MVAAGHRSQLAAVRPRKADEVYLVVHADKKQRLAVRHYVRNASFREHECRPVRERPPLVAIKQEQPPAALGRAVRQSARCPDGEDGAPPSTVPERNCHGFLVWPEVEG